MDKSTAQTIIKLYAVLFWIAALFLAIGTLGFLFFSSFLSGMMGGAFTMMAPTLTDEMMGQAFAGTAILSVGLVIILLILAAVAVAYALVGRGLWNREPWARTAALVVCILSVFSFPLGTLVGGFGIWFFGFEPTVKGLLGDTAVPVKKKKR